MHYHHSEPSILEPRAGAAGSTLRRAQSEALACDEVPVHAKSNAGGILRELGLTSINEDYMTMINRRKAAAADPTALNAAANMRLGHGCNNRNEFEKARNHFQAAFEQNPTVEAQLSAANSTHMPLRAAC